MQTNVTHIQILKNIFPKNEVKESFPNGKPTIKVHVQSINREELEDLVFSVPDSVDINFKRSGTGITIILCNK